MPWSIAAPIAGTGVLTVDATRSILTVPAGSTTRFTQLFAAGDLIEAAGVIGEVGTILGKHGVNIASFEVVHSVEGNRGVAVVLVDFMKAHRSWGWMRLVAGPSAYKTVPGLQSAKVMGSGHGGGFTLRPSATHQGLLCRFDAADAAMDFLHGEQVQAYRARARECWGGLLAISSARGQWDQQSWGLSDAPSQQLSPQWQQRLNTRGAAASAVALGKDSASAEMASVAQAAASAPLGVLTRASIQPSKTTAFWRHAPATQASLDAAPGCLLAMGLGEAPLVRQCTFSLWQDEKAMLGYAQEGAHQMASSAAWRQKFFSESLFVRMRVLRMAGLWQGQDFGNSLGWREVAHG